MQTIQLNPSLKKFLVHQDDSESSLGSVLIVAPFRIGRREGFDLCLPSPNVSGLHAEILEEDGHLWLHDLNSTNGTFVNGERIEETVELQDNDSIVFGNMRFQVVLDPSDRLPAATIPNAEPPVESPEQKFQRLLDSGAIPFFQPIYQISFDSQNLIGYEVLGRSRIFGLKTPQQMFAAALPLEMESELSRVLRQRGIKAAQGKLPEDLKLFVNTHPAELESNVLGASMQDLRETYPYSPITLEMSETKLGNLDSFSELRGLLKNLDIGLALHDFNATNIDLAELNEIAPDIVKFDCALLQNVDQAPIKQRRLIRAMVKMVKAMGIIPMAEYIETKEEHEALVQLGFEYTQGFYYGRPIDIETIATPVEKQNSAKTLKSPKAQSSTGTLRPLDLLKKNAKQDISLAEQNKTTSDAHDTINPSRPGDSKWLMQQLESHYTIQLMVAHSKNLAEQFIAKQPLPGKYAIYPKRGKNNDLFVVLHGIFVDRAKAKPRAESFKELGIFPLIRRISAVQNEAKKEQSEGPATSAI